MRHVIVFALSLIASTAAWSQGSACGASNVGSCVETGGVMVHTPGQGGPAPEQCLPKLAALATDKLRAQLLAEKAVTKQVMNTATITEAKLGAACEQTCATYNMTKSKIFWAKTSPGLVLGSPGYGEQLAYKNLPIPPMPGQAELAKCLPVAATTQWCPPSGAGIGAASGPRQKNPLDGLGVCITQAGALTEMKNFDLQFVAHCARPNIVDAADRISAEKVCVATAIKAKSAQDAAATASPVAGGARTKP